MTNGCIIPLAFCGLLLCAAIPAASKDIAANSPEIVAHRGFSYIAPENTLASTRKAIEVGADWCECDVYRTADGAIVIMHDDKVDRTTNGHGKVVDLTLAEIKRLDAGSWKGRAYAKEPIPTLAEYLATLKGSPCKSLIEIKMRGISDKVVAAVRDAKMVDHAGVIAFDQNVVKEVRVLEPQLPCGWLCGDSKDWRQIPPGKQADWIVAQARKCNASFVDLDHKMLSADLVAELQRHKVTVWAWTVDDPKVMDTLFRWGVTGITTNRPDELRKLNKRN